MAFPGIYLACVRKLWRWYLARGMKAKVCLAVVYTWAVLATGSGLAALTTANATHADNVPKAYRYGVQEATDYLNGSPSPDLGTQSSWCQRVHNYGIFGSFQQTVEDEEAYMAGCDDVWSDFNG